MTPSQSVDPDTAAAWLYHAVAYHNPDSGLMVEVDVRHLCSLLQEREAAHAENGIELEAAVERLAWDRTPFVCGHCRDTPGGCDCCGGSEIVDLLTGYDHVSLYDGSDWEDVAGQAAQRIRLLTSERDALASALSSSNARALAAEEALRAINRVLSPQADRTFDLLIEQTQWAVATARTTLATKGDQNDE